MEEKEEEAEEQHRQQHARISSASSSSGSSNGKCISGSIWGGEGWVTEEEEHMRSSGSRAATS